MKSLFSEVEVPAAHRRNPFARSARWLSWSESARDALQQHATQLLALPAPQQVSVRGCEPYEATFSYQLSRLPRPLQAFAVQASAALLHFRPSREIVFFVGMLEAPLDSASLHRLFALLRAGVVRLTGDHRAALHAPLVPERKDPGFPLHADLFLTERLWLLFDDVGAGRGGASTFLSRANLFALLAEEPTMTERTRRRVRYLMRGRLGSDAFDELFALLHGDDHPWSASLGSSLRRTSTTIKLHRGEGYLLDDRHWLHGRTASRSGVTESRFRRLVYGQLL